MAVGATGRRRREQILGAAAGLFAVRGYHGVSMDEIGAAVGLTGPGLYRHFRGKEEMLSELLVGISERLLDGGRAGAILNRASGESLDALLQGHIDFALDDRDLIVLQDRDLDSLPGPALRRVRKLQREYVEIWVRVVAETYPSLGTVEQGARVRAGVHAVFGLLNSTPYSATARHVRPTPTRGAMADLLRELALGAFSALAAGAREEP
ncbi:TetR/AcrR family transcriptional regulator [Streptomyces tanashiensis]|uniref:TetR/AcrR family transcriptional regulator n=1 Tax=Streptomyces tanashiensis TaxID=67367 RepID=UPI0036EE82D6